MSAMKHLAILIHDGHFGRVHYGVLTAVAAAESGKTVTLLFSGEAVRVLARRYALPDDEHRAKALRVRGLQDLFDGIEPARVQMLVCKDSLRLAELSAEDLRTDLSLEVCEVADFIDTLTTDSATLTF